MRSTGPARLQPPTNGFTRGADTQETGLPGAERLFLSGAHRRFVGPGCWPTCGSALTVTRAYREALPGTAIAGAK
jgi:hypothetical protein